MPEAAKTKVSNLEQTVLNIEQLPRTFRDAIEIGRNLNIEYLWIDSLCIVQDSNEDWEREAAAMSKVYSHAVVTIAVGVTDHSDGGCLLRLDPSGLPQD